MLANLLIPLASFGSVSLIGILMTPFFIKHFNYDGLGIISNTNAILQSLFFIGGALTTVYARVYSNAVNNHNKNIVIDELNNLLSWLAFFAAICGACIGGYALFFQDFIFHYYALAFLSCAIILKSQSYTLIPFSQNKIYINSLIDSSRTILRNIFCLIIAIALIPNINANSIAMLLSAIVVIMVLMRCYPDNNIFIFKKIVLNDNVKNSIWVCINQGGAYLFSFADIFLINILMGHFTGGVYSILIQLPLLLKTISSVAQSSISSFAVKLHAISTDKIHLIDEVLVKCFTFYSFFIGSAFLILSEYKYTIFKIWLGNSFNSDILSAFDYVCYITMIVSLLSLINIFLAGWGLFALPAKLTVIFSVASLVSVILYNFISTKISFVFVFSIIYFFLIAKNVICLGYYLNAAGLGVYKLFKLGSLSVFIIAGLYLLLKSIKYIITDEIHSLGVSVACLILLSLPFLNSFRNLKKVLE